MQKSSHSPQSVSEDTLKEQVTAIFDKSEEEETYKNLWNVLKQVMKHGLDYRKGNPLKGTWKHLKKVAEEHQEKWESEGNCHTWGQKKG